MSFESFFHISGITGIIVYIFMCYCLKRICLKLNDDPGVWIWIPIAQLFPLARIAQMSYWTLLWLIVPLVNLVYMLMLFGKIAKRLGYSAWTSLVMLIPIVGIFYIPYLAFTESTPKQ